MRKEGVKMKKHHALITAVLIATLSSVTAYADNPGTLMKDVNFDGVINAVDASMVLSEYAKSSAGEETTLSETQRYVADTNYDGQVTAVDASCILSDYALRSADKDIPTETVLFCITENGHELRNKALTIEGAEKYIDNLIKNGSDAEYGITADITIYEGKDIIKKNRTVKE